VFDSIIVGIEAIAAIIFLIAFIFSYKIFGKTKKTTDIWLLISFAIFIAFLMATFNSAEWFYEESVALDSVGEYLSIIFSIVWIYIAYRFISIKNV
jgi:hypothetical protein